MKKALFFFLIAGLPLWGLSQMSGGQNVLYPDFDFPGQHWISTSGATVYIPSSGFYYFSISTSTGSLPHDFVEVKVDGVTTSTLAANSNYTPGGSYPQLKGFRPFEVRVRMDGPFNSCATGTITIDMYAGVINPQHISTYTVYTSTYAPSQLVFKPTALVADHKGFWSHRKVVASQKITIHDGVTLSPISTQQGAVPREFKIATCVSKTGGGNPESFPPAEAQMLDQPIDLPALRLVQNPVGEEIRLELTNTLEAADYTIHSMDGRQVQSGQLFPGTTNLPAHELANGTYLIRCQVDGQVFNEKLVVRH